MVIPQRSSQTDDQKADAAGQIVGVSESYKYDGEESRVHFELRSERSRMYHVCPRTNNLRLHITQHGRSANERKWPYAGRARNYDYYS